MIHEASPITVEDGWTLIDEKGFKPLARVLDDGRDYRTRHGGEGPEAWSQIYTTVYRMCVQRDPPGALSEALYEKVKATLKYYLQTTSLPAMKSVHGEFMLGELGRRWANHKLMVRWVKKVFSYVDRYYVKRYEKPTLEKLGILVFKEEIFESIKGDVRNAILEIIMKERAGAVVNRSLLKQVLDLFAEMGMGGMEVYTEDFENPFLETTAEFYRRAAATWVEEDSFPAFLHKADKALIQENERAAMYLHQQTQDRLLKVIEKEVLHRHQQRMLEKENSGLVALLQNNRYESLKTMFRLYSRARDGLSPIAIIFKNHIKKEGMEIVRLQKSRVESARAAAASSNTAAASFAKSEMSSAKPEYIRKLLDLHEHYMDLVHNCFEDHAVFTKAMKEAFERFVNEQVGDAPTAMLFANYCDSLLSISGIGSKMEEEEVEAALDKLVLLFNYLTEKDMYQEFCRKQLSKRLLLDRSHSDDAERFLIAKLKQRCGSHFTSKLEGMITDIQTGKDAQERFTKHVNKDGEDTDMSNASVAIVDGVEFSVRVLTTGHWPTYQQHKSLILPSPLQRCTLVFEEFYQTGTSQRILRWVHSLGKGVLLTSLFVGKGSNKLEISTSTHQMCILNLYNYTDSMTFAKIKEAVDPDDTDLVKTSLISLTKKYPLLIKSPRVKEIRDTDIFKLNLRHTINRRRISIPMPMAKVTEKEKQAARASVIEDRRHGIEAAIVRVMKQHKKLEHQMLIMEVCKLCNPVFHPEPRLIKERIEELIGREYLARDETHSSTYKYLA